MPKESFNYSLALPVLDCKISFGTLSLAVFISLYVVSVFSIYFVDAEPLFQEPKMSTLSRWVSKAPSCPDVDFCVIPHSC